MLTVSEIPVNGVQHPSPPDPCLPKHEFTMALIAPKNSGKTTLLINLLKFYKGYFHKIIVFSPSIRNDEKWAYAKQLVILKENRELKKIIKDYKQKKRKDNPIVQTDPPKFLLDKTPQEKPALSVKFSGKLDPDLLFDDFNDEVLTDILDQQNDMILFLESQGYTKHKADRILLIFDDPVGSPLFNSRHDSTFKALNANHRHKSVSVLMVSQAYKEIPKTVRTQFSCLIIFKIPNEQETKVIYEEYPMGLSKTEWYKAYKECTSKPHGFMFIDTAKPEELQIMSNFSYAVGQKSLKRKYVS